MDKSVMRSLARDLRKNQTFAEQILWSRLRSRQLSGFKFRRQHPIDNYILDFYCSKAHLAVEIDGGQHAEEENMKRDEQRTANLNQRGIRVIRYWTNYVLENIDDVIDDIYAILSEMEKE
jgi:very-short-patch-repair endonuclease